jgi:hypothetical protein
MEKIDRNKGGEEGKERKRRQESNKGTRIVKENICR